MKKKMKLAVLGIVIMVTVLGTAFFFQTVGNGKNSARPIRVACVGDSITEGFAYPDDLGALLGVNYTVGNFGEGGTTIALKAQTPYMNQTAFHEAEQFQPKIVVIMLGANDASPENEQYIPNFVNDYVKLINAFQTLSSNPQIWIVKPPPVFHNGTGLSTEFFNENVIPRIEQVAEEANLPLIDVYSAFAGHSDYMYDGVHPNSEGSKLIAQVIYDALTSK
jgi:lysophospholipase L1-like esterase